MLGKHDLQRFWNDFDVEFLWISGPWGRKHEEYLVAFRYPSEKYEIVSWDEYPQYMEKITHVPGTTNQYRMWEGKSMFNIVY